MAINPRKICALTLVIESQGELANRFMVSLPKVEKVVNAPRKPIKTSDRVSGENSPCDSASCERRPITKHPKILTVSVPTGKTWFFDQS